MNKMEKNFVSMENFTDFVYYDTGKIVVFYCFQYYWNVVL